MTFIYGTKFSLGKYIVPYLVWMIYIFIVNLIFVGFSTLMGLNELLSSILGMLIYFASFFVIGAIFKVSWWRLFLMNVVVMLILLVVLVLLIIAFLG